LKKVHETALLAGQRKFQSAPQVLLKTRVAWTLRYLNGKTAAWGLTTHHSSGGFMKYIELSAHVLPHPAKNKIPQQGTSNKSIDH
jgi:hypothetical protein